MDTEKKQLELDKRYIRMASIWAENSYCQRRKVGALIVKDKMIISDGYNGTPSGFENVCEDENNLTKPYVLHAEANAITKIARSNNSSDGATMYVTASPCCLLYTSDAADDLLCVDLGGLRTVKKKKKKIRIPVSYTNKEWRYVRFPA